VLDVADAGGVVDDGLVLVLAFLLPGGGSFFCLAGRRADAHRTPELLQSFRVIQVPGIQRCCSLSSYMMMMDVHKLKCRAIQRSSADFIMAAGPPALISSRMGLSDGSSFMRTMQTCSCSLWAGLSTIVATAGSCISALPISSAIPTDCGFCISCCIVATSQCTDRRSEAETAAAGRRRSARRPAARIRRDRGHFNGYGMNGIVCRLL
jgi:hypothetical protein